MHIQTLQEPIEVGVVFTQRGMRPVWFHWQGKRRMVQQITWAWSQRDGGLVHRYFSVTDGDLVYELRFDARALHWQLTKVASDG